MFKKLATVRVRTKHNDNKASSYRSGDDEARDYKYLLQLYEAAKNDNTKHVVDFFNGRDGTLEELAPRFIYKTASPLENTFLHVAAFFNSKNTAELIVDKLEGPSILRRTDSNGDTALHVAAKAGHVNTAKALIWKKCDVESSSSIHGEDTLRDPKLLGLKNNQGNTALHEAMINGHSEVVEALTQADPQVSWYLNNAKESPLYLAAQAGSLKCVEYMLELNLQMNTDESCLQGKSPTHAVILSAASCKESADILKLLLEKEPRFINLKDEEGRTVLHLAASFGYLEAVRYLLANYGFMVVQRDNRGFFPIHTAAIEDHVDVIKELLLHCPHPGEMLGENHQNMLHVAAESGAINVVNYVLRTPEMKMLINQRDRDGNTPLHLATMSVKYSWQPKIVWALAQDKKVDRSLVNNQRLTALQVVENQIKEERGVMSYRKRLIWTALEAAGETRAPSTMIHNECSPSTHSETTKKNDTYYQEEINTLLLVATLVVTVTFAAGFSMPGGLNDSKQDPGTANMLGRSGLIIYIFCDTIAMYSSFLAVGILFWAQLGDPHDTKVMVVRFAVPFLGVSIIMMSMAFMAGVHIVVSKLSWLSIAVLVMEVLFLMVVAVLSFPYFVPFRSSNRILRHVAYYPILLLIPLTGNSPIVNVEKQLYSVSSYV